MGSWPQLLPSDQPACRWQVSYTVSLPSWQGPPFVLSGLDTHSSCGPSFLPALLLPVPPTFGVHTSSLIEWLILQQAHVAQDQCLQAPWPHPVQC